MARNGCSTTAMNHSSTARSVANNSSTDSPFCDASAAINRPSVTFRLTSRSARMTTRHRRISFLSPPPRPGSTRPIKTINISNPSPPTTALMRRLSLLRPADPAVSCRLITSSAALKLAANAQGFSTNSNSAAIAAARAVCASFTAQ
jgi:hypothetical protein